ncbi:MAG: TIGR00366 family protein [Candidatus Hydrogenedentota bacterium]
MPHPTEQNENGPAQGPKPHPEREGWMDWLARLSEHYVPDALTTAIILMVILAAMAMTLGNTVTETVDAYYRGLWMLLAFSMQMTLMLTLSLTLAETRPFKSGVIYLSRLPRTAPQVIVGAVLLSSVISYSNWGLSIALLPLIAVHFCKQAEQKGIAVDFIWVMAVLAGAGSVWQFGLSATAPLQMTAENNFLAETTDLMPLSTTIWSPAAITMVVSFLAVTIVTGILFMPKKVKPISHFAGANELAEAAITAELAGHVDTKQNYTFAQKVERTSLTLIPMWIALAAWLIYHFGTKKASLDINSMITILLLACLVLHRTVAGFTGALQRVIVSAWPVIVMYHLYAGVAGLIQYTAVGSFLAESIEPISTRYTLPFLTALISTIVAIFIPTSGGQWQIQGYVTVSTAMDAGISPQRAMLALGIGDHMGNLISPFWAVVGAGIARVDFRQIFGYRLIFAAIWFVMGVVIFTFLPC